MTTPRFSLAGRVALVTGAARGIGYSIAVELGAAGAAVAVIGRSVESLSEVVAATQATGARVLALAADVGIEAEVVAAVERCRAELGPVDVLVNNAAITAAGNIHELELDDWETLLRTNLTSVYLFTRAVSAAMCERGWGRIVNIGSVVAHNGGLRGSEVSPSYTAAKAGMHGFTRTVSRDLAPFGVTVNVVAPGQTATRMTDLLTPEQIKTVVDQIPVGRLGTTEEVAYAVRFLASHEAAYITGVTLDVNGGIVQR
jgi:3-oxoacyl-[acyl-carrier protein] reductase